MPHLGQKLNYEKLTCALWCGVGPYGGTAPARDITGIFVCGINLSEAKIWDRAQKFL